MNRRVRPQDLQETHPRRMRMSPLVRRIDEIDTSHVIATPWYPGKWKARRWAFLEQEKQRLEELRRRQAIRNMYK